MKFLQLIRWKNLLIIGLTQILFLFPILSEDPQLSIQSLWLILATLLTAAAGYIINDYYDVEADKINKPNKVFIGTYIQKPDSRRVYFVLVILSLWFGYYALKEDTKIILFLHLLLFLYSYKLKRLPFIGNLVVSFCSAATIFIIERFVLISADASWGMVNTVMLIIPFSILAFSLTFIRELYKDIEDIEGDRAIGYKTFAIIGSQTANKITISIALILTGAFYIDLVLLLHNPYKLGIGIGVISLGLIYLLIHTIKAKNKEDFAKLSSYSKLVMVLGLLSVLLFY